MSIKANKDNAVFISNAYLQEEGYTASATVTFTIIPLDGHNITLNGTVFTYRTTPAVANDVALGVDISASIDNLLTEALPAVATYTKVGTDSIFIEYATIGAAGNLYTIASNFMTVPSTLSGGSDTPDADWVDNTPMVDYKLPEIGTSVWNGTGYDNSTSTALITDDEVAENDPVKLYNSTDGLFEGSLGTTTTTTVTNATGIHDVFGDGSCVATYNLDGNANDLGGNYNGTATDVTYEVGKFGQCAVFNGSSSTISNVNAMASGKTISFWVKSATSSINNRVLQMGSTGWNSVLSFHTSNELRIWNNAGTEYTIAAPLNVMEWNHIVCYINGTNATSYLNAVKVLDNTNIGTITLDSLTIGLGYGAYFNGSIDQVRIFNKALTPTEVTVLYNEEATKYTSDITSLGLTNAPTKAWLDKPITVSTVTETNEARCIAQDETLGFVSSTLTEYVGTNANSGLLTTGDSIQLNGTTDVVCSNVVESDLGGGIYQYTCTIPSQASAPTSAKVLDRSVTSAEASDIYDNVNDKFIKTYNKVEQQGRVFKYKLKADTDVEITKVNIEMNKQG